MNLSPLPTLPLRGSPRRKETELVFFTIDPAVELLTLGKEPSWRLHIVTQHLAHHRLHSEATVHREQRGTPTLQRSSALLSLLRTIPAAFLRFWNTQDTSNMLNREAKVCHWAPQLTLFYTHSQEEVSRFLRADFPLTAPFGWLWSMTTLCQKPRRSLLKEASFQFQPCKVSYYPQLNHGSNFFWGN